MERAVLSRDTAGRFSWKTCPGICGTPIGLHRCRWRNWSVIILSGCWNIRAARRLRLRGFWGSAGRRCSRNGSGTTWDEGRGQWAPAPRGRDCRRYPVRYTVRVKLRVAWIGKTKEPAYQALTNEYLKRISRYNAIEPQEFPNEAAFLKWLEKSVPKPLVVLLDSRGKQLSSEELAEFIRDHQDRGTSQMMFAIGPADGFRRKQRARRT